MLTIEEHEKIHELCEKNDHEANVELAKILIEPVRKRRERRDAVMDLLLQIYHKHYLKDPARFQNGVEYGFDEWLEYFVEEVESL